MTKYENIANCIFVKQCYILPQRKNHKVNHEQDVKQLTFISSSLCRNILQLEDRIRVVESFLDDENIVTIASISTHTVNNQSLDSQNIEPPSYSQHARSGSTRKDNDVVNLEIQRSCTNSEVTKRLEVHELTSTSI